jgi:hypothetical protein
MKNRGKIDYTKLPGNWDYKKAFEEIDQTVKRE